MYSSPSIVQRFALAAVLALAGAVLSLSLQSSATSDTGNAAKKCSAGTATYRVAWTAPAGPPVSVVKLRLSYEAGALGMPDADADARKRVKKTPKDALVVAHLTPNAFDVLVSKSGSLPAQPFTVDFDRCSKDAKSVPAKLSCTVLDCASSYGPVSDCKCEAERP